VMSGEFVFLSFTGGLEGADVDTLDTPGGPNATAVILLDLDALHDVMGVVTVTRLFIIDGSGSGEINTIEIFSLNAGGAPPAPLPGAVSVASVNAHTGVGDVPIDVDPAASVGTNSGAVTTESRIEGVTRVEIGFADPLHASVGALGAGAVTITPDPGVAVATSLVNGDQTLVLDFTPALPDTQTYTVALTEAVIAAGASTPGDRDFELRALTGNVVSESGAGPQVVNAIDIGLTGIRGHFGQAVGSTTASFDITQDGAINALDFSCVRLSCGVFGHAAP